MSTCRCLVKQWTGGGWVARLPCCCLASALQPALHLLRQTCALLLKEHCSLSGLGLLPCTHTAGCCHSQAALCATHHLRDAAQHAWREIVGVLHQWSAAARKATNPAATNECILSLLRHSKPTLHTADNWIAATARTHSGDRQSTTAVSASTTTDLCLLLLNPTCQKPLQVCSPVLLAVGSSIISWVALPAARSASVNNTRLTLFAPADCTAKLMAPCIHTPAMRTKLGRVLLVLDKASWNRCAPLV